MRVLAFAVRKAVLQYAVSAARPYPPSSVNTFGERWPNTVVTRRVDPASDRYLWTLTTEVTMKSHKRKCASVRSPRVFAPLAAATYMTLVFVGCSDRGGPNGNQNNADNTATSSKGAGGQNNQTGGAQATAASGGTGVQGGVSGAKMTVPSSGGTGAVQAIAGASGMSVTVSLGGTGGARAAAGASGQGIPAAAAGGGQGGAGASGTAGGEPPDVACNPADQTAPPKPVTLSQTGAAPTGPYKVTVEQDPSIPTQTELRPELKAGVKVPIIAWGNTGCSNNSSLFPEFLTEIASHGFLIMDAGVPNGSGSVNSDKVAMTQAIDWAFKENERPCSQYYHKLDTTKVAAMGQSCGGLMTYAVAGDPRLTTVIFWNSGLMKQDAMMYNSLHTPMAFFIGGSSDIAYSYSEADYKEITTNMHTANLPIFNGNQDLGHYATYDQDNGGEYARAGIGWLKWQLMGDESADAKGLFVGANCGLCNTKWVIKKKNLD
jgi:hypothetical protein